MFRGKIQRRNLARNLRLPPWVDFKQLRGVYKDYPCFVISAGPSLDLVSNEQLASLYDYGIVICTATAAPRMEGMRVDFIVATEHLPQEIPDFPDSLFVHHFDSYIPENSGRDFTVFFGTDPVMPLAELLQAWMVQPGNCGASAACLAHYLGCTDILLIGQDNCMYNKQQYAKGIGRDDFTYEITSYRNEPLARMVYPSWFRAKFEEAGIPIPYYVTLLKPEFTQSEDVVVPSSFGATLMFFRALPPTFSTNSPAGITGIKHQTLETFLEGKRKSKPTRGVFYATAFEYNSELICPILELVDKVEQSLQWIYTESNAEKRLALLNEFLTSPKNTVIDLWAREFITYGPLDDNLYEKYSRMLATYLWACKDIRKELYIDKETSGTAQGQEA